MGTESLFLICLVAVTAVAGLEDYEEHGDGNFIVDGKAASRASKSPSSSLQFVYPMKNSSRAAGEALKLKCEVRGSPPPSEFREEIQLTIKSYRKIDPNSYSTPEKNWAHTIEMMWEQFAEKCCPLNFMRTV